MKILPVAYTIALEIISLVVGLAENWFFFHLILVEVELFWFFYDYTTNNSCIAFFYSSTCYLPQSINWIKNVNKWVINFLHYLQDTLFEYKLFCSQFSIHKQHYDNHNMENIKVYINQHNNDKVKLLFRIVLAFLSASSFLKSIRMYNIILKHATVLATDKKICHFKFWKMVFFFLYFFICFSR